MLNTSFKIVVLFCTVAICSGCAEKMLPRMPEDPYAEPIEYEKNKEEEEKYQDYTFEEAGLDLCNLRTDCFCWGDD